MFQMQAEEKRTQDADLESLPLQLSIMPHFLLRAGTESSLGSQSPAFFLHLPAFTSFPFITLSQICSSLATWMKFVSRFGTNKKMFLNPEGNCVSGVPDTMMY